MALAQTLASIELEVFARFGHREIADEVWRRGLEVDRDAAREARGRVRARFGERSEYGGRILPLLGIATIIGMSGAIVGAIAPTHRNTRYSPLATYADAILLVSVVGLVLVYAVAVVMAGSRPVSAGVLGFATRILLPWVPAVAAAGFAADRAAAPWPFVFAATGAGVAALMTGWFWIVRRRRPVDAVTIDAAPASAIEEQLPLLRDAQEQLRIEVAERLRDVGADEAQLVEWRTGVAGEQGLEDSAAAPAGDAMIREQTERWLERDRRFRSPARGAEPAGEAGEGSAA